MGYMHGARNASIALMIASQAFSDQPKVLLMITLVVIIMLLVLLPFSYLYKIKDIQTK
jgi:cytochrome bd-type quinol oxidase subunit 2